MNNDNPELGALHERAIALTAELGALHERAKTLTAELTSTLARIRTTTKPWAEPSLWFTCDISEPGLPPRLPSRPLIDEEQLNKMSGDEQRRYLMQKSLEGAIRAERSETKLIVHGRAVPSRITQRDD